MPLKVCNITSLYGYERCPYATLQLQQYTL